MKSFKKYCLIVLAGTLLLNNHQTTPAWSFKPSWMTTISTGAFLVGLKGMIFDDKPLDTWNDIKLLGGAYFLYNSIDHLYHRFFALVEPITPLDDTYQSNSTNYDEVAKAFKNLVNVCNSSTTQVNPEQNEALLELCKALIKQRKDYWESCSDENKKPLYIRENIDLADILQECKFDSLDSSAVGVTNFLDECDKATVQCDTSVVNQPARVLQIMNHEVTHLEQLANTLALKQYIAQSKLKIESTLRYNYTHKTANNIFAALKNLNDSTTENIVKILNKNKEINSDIEQEAERNTYYFIHNPYLVNKLFENQRPFYDAAMDNGGYDCYMKSRFMNYATKYYATSNNHAKHKAEYESLKKQIQLPPENLLIENSLSSLNDLKSIGAGVFGLKFINDSVSYYFANQYKK